MVDKIMNYNEATDIVKKEGWDEFLETLQKEHPKHDLYACSMSWYESDEYICKAKGTYGDLIIDWEHKQEKEMVQC